MLTETYLFATRVDPGRAVEMGLGSYRSNIAPRRGVRLQRHDDSRADARGRVHPSSVRRAERRFGAASIAASDMPRVPSRAGAT